MPTLSDWWMAARPRTLAAAVAPVLVGTAVAYAHGRASLLPAAAAAAGAMLIQIGTNLANDYFDFIKGADTADRVGPRRVTASGIIAPRDVRNATIAVFGAAALVGVYLVGVGGMPIVWIGLASIASGIAYTGGPFPLGYNGLGDLFVYLFFGHVAVAGTCWVQARELPPEVWVAGHVVGTLSTAIIVVNNLRDRHTDARAGKRTLAVRLGERTTRAEYLALLAAGLGGIAATALVTRDAAPLLGLAAIPLAVATARRFMQRDGAELNPSLGETARLLAVTSALYAAGLALSRHV
jgi:1,4-dihydroxy-2-naphthoate octaprenyltransferase